MAMNEQANYRDSVGAQAGMGKTIYIAIWFC